MWFKRPKCISEVKPIDGKHCWQQWKVLLQWEWLMKNTCSASGHQLAEFVGLSLSFLCKMKLETAVCFLEASDGRACYWKKCAEGQVEISTFPFKKAIKFVTLVILVKYCYEGIFHWQIVFLVVLSIVGSRDGYTTWGCSAGCTRVAACWSAAAFGSSAAAAAAAAAEYARGWGHNSWPEGVKKGPPSAANRVGHCQYLTLGASLRWVCGASRRTVCKHTHAQIERKKKRGRAGGFILSGWTMFEQKNREPRTSAVLMHYAP